MISLSWDVDTYVTKTFSEVCPKDVIVLKNGAVGYVEWITEEADHLGDRMMNFKFLRPDADADGTCWNGIQDVNVLRVWKDKVLFVLDGNHPYAKRCKTFRELYDAVIAPKLPPELRQ